MSKVSGIEAAVLVEVKTLATALDLSARLFLLQTSLLGGSSWFGGASDLWRFGDCEEHLPQFIKAGAKVGLLLAMFIAGNDDPSVGR